MTAEPESPDEPRLAPAGGSGESKPPRPKAPLIEGRALPQPGSRGGGILIPLAAGVIGGLVGAGAVYLLSMGPSEDNEARQVVNQLNTKVAELTEAVNAKAASSSAASVEQVSQVRSLLNTVASSAKATDEAVQSLTQKVQSLEQKPAAEPAKEAIQAEIAAQVGPVAAQIAPLASQIAPLADRIAILERAQGERVSDARTAGLTLALANLKRAVAEGRPFAADLAALESLTSAKLPVSDLEPYKDQGVPSLHELQRDLDDASRGVIQKHYQGKGDSLVSEVISRARAVVQVKPAGGAGDSVEAILGRMESALKASDLKGALKEAASLEGPAKGELQAWLKRAEARAAADEAIRKTDSELLASLAKSPAGQ